ncbi:hypothetical protein AGMMS50212_16860 [Spirochaetia bacterium]|nr:hypothetical protein AGMMS50212_16860 [Spirochaetia bacterium]
MHCTVDGQEPPEDEINAWLKLVTEIAGKGNLKAVQIYGKARPSPSDPVCAEAPPESLERRAGMLEMMLDEAGIKDIKVRVFE